MPSFAPTMMPGDSASTATNTAAPIDWAGLGSNALNMLPVLAAFQGDKSSGNKSGTESGTTTITKQFGAESDLERRARELQSGGLSALDSGLNAGPSFAQLQKDYYSSSNDLASMLQQLQQSGGIPSQNDFTTARNFAEQATSAQAFQNQLALRDAEKYAARQSALTGRGGMDFMLQNQRAQLGADLAGKLGAQQTQIASQYAQQLPQARLGFAQDLAQLRSGLASQAMQNRMALLGMGSNVQSQQFNQRAAQAGQTTSNYGGYNQSGSSKAGGGMSQLGGALSGAAMGAQLGSIVPGIGTGIGAAAGGLIGLFGSK